MEQDEFLAKAQSAGAKFGYRYICLSHRTRNRCNTDREMIFYSEGALNDWSRSHEATRDWLHFKENFGGCYLTQATYWKVDE